MDNQINFNVNTPSLLMDIDKLENNILEAVNFSKEYNLNYRPHIKTHKSIKIAKKQIDYGAIGVTVATVGEAEVMAEGGIKDILIAYTVTSTLKLERIKHIMQKSKITLSVDSKEQVVLLNDVFKEHQQKLNVWIEINSGLNRSGVEPNEAANLAKYIKNFSSLTIDGVFTHAGHAYAALSDEEINNIAIKEANNVLESAELCERSGIPIQSRSIGSTPTYKIGGKIEGITEIRPGNSVFFDMVQVGLNVASIEQCALTILSTIASVKQGRIVIDAGSKTLNLDKGAHGNDTVIGHGYIKEYPEFSIGRLSEEHGMIDFDNNKSINMKV